MLVVAPDVDRVAVVAATLAATGVLTGAVTSATTAALTTAEVDVDDAVADAFGEKTSVAAAPPEPALVIADATCASGWNCAELDDGRDFFDLCVEATVSGLPVVVCGSDPAGAEPLVLWWPLARPSSVALGVVAPVPALPADEVDAAGAATATPQPTNAAAPTPSATASPPIRPTYLEAPIAFSCVDDAPPNWRLNLSAGVISGIEKLVN
jgi:hypothetical protein